MSTARLGVAVCPGGGPAVTIEAAHARQTDGLFFTTSSRFPSVPIGGIMWAMARMQKITFGEMRDMGVPGVLIYCSAYKCSHGTAISGNHWPDDVRLSDIEPLFTCMECGKKGADVRPNFSRDKHEPRAAMGKR
jgi:hypothetical protein